MRNHGQQNFPYASPHCHQLPALPCKAIGNSPLTCPPVLGQHPKHNFERWSHTPPPQHQPRMVATLLPRMKKVRSLHTPQLGPCNQCTAQVTSSVCTEKMVVPHSLLHPASTCQLPLSISAHLWKTMHEWMSPLLDPMHVTAPHQSEAPPPYEPKVPPLHVT